MLRTLNERSEFSESVCVSRAKHRAIRGLYAGMVHNGSAAAMTAVNIAKEIKAYEN